MILNKYFDLYWQNPFKTYNKIKKYFKPLFPKFQFNCFKGREAKILKINAFDVCWKDKWDSPRHERNPVIDISIFNYFHILITFITKDNLMDDMVYWESALNWIYYSKPLHKAIKDSTGWQHYNETTKEYETILFRVLKEPWQTMFDNKKLPKVKYERNIKDRR